MSSPRYDWWGYVKGMIRRYPSLRQEHEALHSQTVTQSYSGMPGSGDAGRTTENVALRQLPGTKQREYEAVSKAVGETLHMRNSVDRLKIIDLVFWKRTHTLEGAALTIPCSLRTAQQWHGDFIRLVAKNYGLMDD